MSSNNQTNKNASHNRNRSQQSSKPKVELKWAGEELDSDTGDLSLTAQLNLKLSLPEQNEYLPHKIEEMVEVAGQELKRLLYGKVIEKADQTLVLSNRKGKDGLGIELMGTRPYTFKAVFGTIRVKRIRIRHKADRSTEIPSHRAWVTPRQVCITKGLKAAICDLAAKQSYNNTVRAITARSGESKLICKSSVKNVVHQEGEKLRQANARRAKEVFQKQQDAKALLGGAESYLAEEFFEQVWLNKEDLEAEEYDEDELNELYQEIEWDPRENLDKVANAPLASIDKLPSTSAINETSLSTITTMTMTEKDKNLIVVEPDEVMVRSQEADSEWLIHYNAVVVKAGITHYLTAPTSAQLFYQVGGLLAKLGLNKVENRLLVIGDGAVWIRRWIDSIGINSERKTSVLCWLHLKKHCSRLIREGLKNRADRAIMRKKVFQYLWRGQVSDARRYISRILTDIEDGVNQIEINNIKALEALKEYLLMRQEHIPDYLMRLRNKEWIANTKIEKFNDFSISQRCKKKNGMKWTRPGVGAIAALETARRNEELRYWREQGKLPRWQEQAA